MKKLIMSILAISMLMLSGCASKSTNILSKTGLEGREVSTYLVGKYIDVKSAKKKLENAGFEIVATYNPVKKGTTIVFTNGALKEEGAKLGRAHASVLRLFIDEKEKIISFTNPVYFGKAYMQDDYEHRVFNEQLKSIHEEFLGLVSSIDKMKFDDLANYHFMVSMPYYGDSDELGVGMHDELIQKAKNYKKGKYFVFELKLSDTSTLIGYDLRKRTKKFVKKIGRANAAILPYTISIEDNKATSMEAKYYIALCYPLLSMTQFTTIATVPGAVAKELAKPFK